MSCLTRDIMKRTRTDSKVFDCCGTGRFRCHGQYILTFYLIITIIFLFLSLYPYAYYNIETDGRALRVYNDICVLLFSPEELILDCYNNIFTYVDHV